MKLAKEKPNYICIYHANCRDGLAAAMAVLRHKPNMEFVAASYGEKPPEVEGKHVVMVDFSYKRDVILGMALEAHSITILDHHKTAEAELVDLPPNVHVHFDMDKSGARLAWEHFHDEVPSLVEYVEDRDLWRFNYDSTKRINEALALQGTNLMTWDRKWDQWCTYEGLDKLNSMGEILVQKFNQDIEALIDAKAYTAPFAGHIVPIINASFIHASELGNRLCVDQPFAVIYTIKDKEVAISLRSKDSGLDVSEIAASFGGGGHRNAAGCAMPIDVFFEMTGKE